MRKQKDIQTKKSLSINELNEALFDFEGLMERSQTPFYLLKETGRSIKKELQLQGDKVYVGVRKLQVTPLFLSVLKEYVIDVNPTYEETKTGFKYEYKGVPVEVTYITRKYHFISHPDSVYYWGESYLLPNPFDTYYKSRFIVR